MFGDNMKNSDVIYCLNLVLKYNYSHLVIKIKSPVHSSICAGHGLLQFKVLHRHHLSKEKFTKMYPRTDPLCNRCRTVTGCLIRTFWTNLENNWTSTFDAFSKVYGVRFPPSPLISIFRVIPEDMLLPRHYSNATALLP